MKKKFIKWKYTSVLTIASILMITVAAFAHTAVPYFIDWSNTNLITTDNVWSVSNDLRVRGYSGSDTPVTPGQDARTVLEESFELDVDANETDPNTLVEGGVAEFEIANPTIALKGSDTAHAPYVNILVNTVGQSNIRFRATIRDLDSSANDAVQQVAVQARYRDDETGPFTDIPAGYIADATDPGTATKVSQIDVILPPEAENIIALEVRVVTVNAVGNDEWIGVDNIDVQSVPTVFPGTCDPVLTVTEDRSDLRRYFFVTGADGQVNVDSINFGPGLQSFSLMNTMNGMVEMPSFTPGTFDPVTATFLVSNPNLPFDAILRATNQFQGLTIRAQCACTPTTTITEDPNLSPGGLSAFNIDTDEVGELEIDHIDAEPGLQSITIDNATNVDVEVPTFEPGTQEEVHVEYSIIDPSQPVDLTVRISNGVSGVIVRLNCGAVQKTKPSNVRRR